MKIRLLVDGITCTGCVEDIERILGEEDGISNVSVNYADGTIDIDYNPNIINEEIISKTMRRLGLRVKSTHL
ncbi:MAG: hypothetical protein Fur0020_09000 [Thermodesulfovibrionia bacterium]